MVTMYDCVPCRFPKKVTAPGRCFPRRAEFLERFASAPCDSRPPSGQNSAEVSILEVGCTAGRGAWWCATAGSR